MKKNMFLVFKSRIAGLAALVAALIGISSCTETIDDSNAVIKKGIMMSEYFEMYPEYSHIKSVFDRVRLGERASDSGDSISSISSVLASRGNYTCFAPTNKAMEKYVSELNGTSDIASLTYEQAKLVAYSCVIDNGDEAAYETPDFSSSGSFGKSNFYDRILTYNMDSDGDYYINNNSKILTADIEVDNGMIHIVDAVVAPSSKRVWELFSGAPNMKIMARLFSETGWADKMLDEVDDDYEKTTHPERMSLNDNDIKNVEVVQKRYFGYTAFVEPDDVMEDWLGVAVKLDEKGEIANWDEILLALTTQCRLAYPNSTSDDLKNADNALNRFVAYHILKGRMAHDRFNYHYNEFRYGYGTDRKDPQHTVYPVNVWDYYVTAGEYPELVKVTQVGHNDKGMENDIYLNRITKHDSKTFNEKEIISEGILVSEYNLVTTGQGDSVKYENNASNGFYFPISNVLLCDDKTRKDLTSERIRFDIVTIMPEMASFRLRGTNYWAFPNGYFDNIINESNDTKIFYLREGYGPSVGGWIDYQGDEFLFGGVYDFTIKLPPVPEDGMYEIRMGVSTNGKRGMAQLYFGEDPGRLTPAGLPFDMRLNGKADSNIPWLEDGDDELTNTENDKAMRNAGYMKGPAYFADATADGIDNIKDGKIVRNMDRALRRIIVTQDLKKNKHYYLRVKSALVKTDSELFVDYFEYARKNVYEGGEAEDIW